MGLQMMMMKVLQLLGAIERYSKEGTKIEESAFNPETHEGWYWYDTDSKINYGQAPKWVVQIIAPIIEILNTLLIPVIILLGTAGTIYAIVLGVKYSKAETADAREEAKKQLIHAAIGIVIMLVALILLKIFVANAFSIFGWVDTTATNNQ